MARKTFLFAFLVLFILHEARTNETIKVLKEASKNKGFDENFCKDLPFECYKCKECHDNTQSGLCIKGAKSSQTRCLCNWGFTGENSIKVIPVKDSSWSRNRIVADDCKKPCHYTADYWNSKCVTPCNVEKCEKLSGQCIEGKCVRKCDKITCEAQGGKCMGGVCKVQCCKNLLEYVPPYSPIKSTHKEYCLNRCKYYELKEGVCEPPHMTPPCDKLCLKLGGSCDMKTGRCRCCKDFTGPHARYEKDYITADYCTVWCPYENEDGERNQLCVNSNWVKRAMKRQSKKMKFKIE